MFTIYDAWLFFLRFGKICWDQQTCKSQYFLCQTFMVKLKTTAYYSNDCFLKELV